MHAGALKAIFLMETVNNDKRYSSGSMYKQSEIRAAAEILAEQGYTNRSDAFLNGISALVFTNPNSVREDGTVDLVYIVLSSDKRSLLGGTDRNWSGGMMLFGTASYEKDFDDFELKKSPMVWDFVKEHRPSLLSRIGAAIADSIKYAVHP